MISTKIHEWLTLIANIGVVIGIFLLITEVNHASRLAEVEAYQARIRDIQELNLQEALSESLSDIFVKIKTDGVKSLTPNEFNRARAWYSAIMIGMQGQYYQYQQGFLDRKSVDITLDDIANGVYTKWKAFDLLDNIEIQEWRNEINRRLASSSET